MSHSVTLTNKAQALDALDKCRAWILRRVEMGRHVVLSLQEEQRTLPQNRHIHPLVEEIAKDIGRATDRESLDDLRWLLVEKWRHETGKPGRWIRSLDGLRMVDVSNRTSAMDKVSASEFLEWLIAEAADLDA